jgi:hypothetical protein
VTVEVLILHHRQRGRHDFHIRHSFLLHMVCLKTQSIPHRKHSASITMTNWLMLFREIIAVYFENHTKHKYTVWKK